MKAQKTTKLLAMLALGLMLAVVVGSCSSSKHGKHKKPMSGKATGKMRGVK